jgi:hypothetical protein
MKMNFNSNYGYFNTNPISHKKQMRPNLRKVVDLFQPDVNGCSRWVEVEEVKNSGLSWSNNGNVRRGIAFAVGEYVWEFRRINNRRNGAIIAMRLLGYNDSLIINQRIRKDIVDELRKQTVSNFAPDCIIPLVENDKEVDHRWGRKDSPKYEYINDVSQQSIDDFQLLSHSHNQFKREQCVKCKETNRRYSPPTGQEFKIGCKNWEDSVGCSGCPLSQPELYC